MYLLPINLPILALYVFERIISHVISWSELSNVRPSTLISIKPQTPAIIFFSYINRAFTHLESMHPLACHGNTINCLSSIRHLACGNTPIYLVLLSPSSDRPNRRPFVSSRCPERVQMLVYTAISSECCSATHCLGLSRIETSRHALGEDDFAGLLV